MIIYALWELMNMSWFVRKHHINWDFIILSVVNPNSLFAYRSNHIFQRNYSRLTGLWLHGANQLNFTTLNYRKESSVWEYHKPKLPMRRLQRHRHFRVSQHASVTLWEAALLCYPPTFFFGVMNFESPGRIGGETYQESRREVRGVAEWAAQRMQKLTSKQMQ